MASLIPINNDVCAFFHFDVHRSQIHYLFGFLKNMIRKMEWDERIALITGVRVRASIWKLSNYFFDASTKHKLCHSAQFI